MIEKEKPLQFKSVLHNSSHKFPPSSAIAAVFDGKRGGGRDGVAHAPGWAAVAVEEALLLVLGAEVAPLRIHHPVAQARWRWQEPMQGSVAEHLLKIIKSPEVEGVLVGPAGPKNRGPKGLQRRPVLGDEVDVIPEERSDAQREHGTDEEQK